MKKIFIYLSILAVLLASVINSCKHTDIEPSSQEIDHAKLWFEENVTSVQLAPAPAALLKSSPSQLKYQFNWQRAKKSKNDSLAVIEVPVIIQGKIAFNQNKKTKSEVVNNSLTRLVVQKNQKTGKYTAFVMNIIGDEDYLTKAQYVLKKNHYLKKDKEFSGRVMYSTLQGELIIGYIYKNGKVQNKILKLADEATVASHLKSDVSKSKQELYDTKEMVCDVEEHEVYEQQCWVTATPDGEITYEECGPWVLVNIYYVVLGCYDDGTGEDPIDDPVDPPVNPPTVVNCSCCGNDPCTCKRCPECGGLISTSNANAKFLKSASGSCSACIHMGLFTVKLHENSLKMLLERPEFALFKNCPKIMEELIYGIGSKADQGLGALADNHFDGRTSYEQIEGDWATLKDDLSNNLFKLGGIDWNENSDLEELISDYGVLLHKTEDFYAHSNYAELYIEYYSSTHNGNLPSELPLFSEGNWPPMFLSIMMNTEKDADGKYIGLYSGSFSIIDNEYIDLWPFKESASDPNSHNLTNKDNATGDAGMLAYATAMKEVYEELTYLKAIMEEQGTLTNCNDD